MLSDENKLWKPRQSLFLMMKRWKNGFLFWQTGSEPNTPDAFFCLLSLTSCILTSAPCGVHHTILGQVHPITLSIYCSINSPERQKQCSGCDMLIMWNVVCWFKFSSLVQRHLTAVFFLLLGVTLVWLQPAL